MTLLTTEIHNHSDPGHALIVFAADRRISRGDSYEDTCVKIFRVPGLNAGMGYFGLAEVPRRNGSRSMAAWLQEFLSGITGCETLEQFSASLADSLNAVVPRAWRESAISGLHIAGFNTESRPGFWYVRNVDDDRQTILEEFQPREDFQRRDASRLLPGEAQVYRNGDIRAHVIAWETIDKSIGSLLNLPDFRQLKTPEDYVGWVKFKMELIAQFYERYCTRSIIGGPVDAFSITRVS